MLLLTYECLGQSFLFILNHFHFKATRLVNVTADPPVYVCDVSGYVIHSEDRRKQYFLVKLVSVEDTMILVTYPAPPGRTFGWDSTQTATILWGITNSIPGKCICRYSLTETWYSITIFSIFFTTFRFICPVSDNFGKTSSPIPNTVNPLISPVVKSKLYCSPPPL